MSIFSLGMHLLKLILYCHIIRLWFATYGFTDFIPKNFATYFKCSLNRFDYTKQNDSRTSDIERSSNRFYNQALIF